MDPISSWLVISWFAKKLTDHHDRYMTPEQYRAIWEAQESTKLLYGQTPIPYPEYPKSLPGPEEV